MFVAKSEIAVKTSVFFCCTVFKVSDLRKGRKSIPEGNELTKEAKIPSHRNLKKKDHEKTSFGNL